jgi:hypothetical protein
MKISGVALELAGVGWLAQGVEILSIANHYHLIAIKIEGRDWRNVAHKQQVLSLNNSYWLLFVSQQLSMDISYGRLDLVRHP